MKANQQTQSKDNFPNDDTTVKAEEKSLIVSKTDATKNLDQTISAPNDYISWFHYNTKNIDKYLTLCPHCKKPTLSAFNRSVIDSAIDYLNGKRIFQRYQTPKVKFISLIPYMVLIGAAFYFF